MPERGGTARVVPQGTTLFKDISHLATLNDAMGELKDAAIFVKGNVIAWVGASDSIPEEYQTADKVVSMKNKVVIPGLVNTHHHMYQNLTRVVAQEELLFGWLTSLYPAWKFMTGNDVYVSAKLAMAELMLTGCTTSSDHLYIYPNDVTLDDTIRAAREIGMRFHPTRGAMSLGESKGGLPPDEVCEEEPECLADMKRVIEEFHDPAPYSMLRMSLAPCAPFVVTNDLMIAAATLARKYPEVRLHTHLAENEEDIDYSLEHYGCRPGEYIKQVGWDQKDVWFAHCCMLDDAECALFRDRGIGIAHCPSSNLRLASGIAPVRKLVDSGVNVGIGVDGSASNDIGDMLAECRLAMLLQRAGRNPKGLTARETLQLGVQGGATNLGRTDIGEIAPGFAADFVAWSMDTLGFTGAMHDPVAALMFCTPGVGYVDTSVINGDIVIQGGAFTTIDLKELIAEHHVCSARICQHLGKPATA